MIIIDFDLVTKIVILILNQFQQCDFDFDLKSIFICVILILI